MSNWNEFYAEMKSALEPDYSGGGGHQRRNAEGRAQRTFFDLERQAAENATLRQMLVDQGIENARLTVELEHQTTRADMKACPYHPDGPPIVYPTIDAKSEATPRNPEDGHETSSSEVGA